ncbi:hypothetical protein [Vibrio alginolyticus]|uniref:hypothetical protein n=1 Tax=Vibrio alginolyticus TaxID=663 RepID=UPI0006CAA4FF|nr:hypothetical protein [Vibrio alginolyticus]KPM98397.1 hypothetical protein AOG25_08095 [Vibrio alginolyticus]
MKNSTSIDKQVIVFTDCPQKAVVEALKSSFLKDYAQVLVNSLRRDVDGDHFIMFGEPVGLTHSGDLLIVYRATATKVSNSHYMVNIWMCDPLPPSVTCDDEQKAIEIHKSFIKAKDAAKKSVLELCDTNTLSNAEMKIGTRKTSINSREELVKFIDSPMADDILTVWKYKHCFNV